MNLRRRWSHLLVFLVVVLLLFTAVGVAGAQALTFSSGSTYGTGAGPRSVAVGDFNKDGNLDLAVADWYGGGVSVLLGDGHGGFAPTTDIATGVNPVSVAVGDFNHDGNLDLAVANYSSDTVSILLGNGHGGFSAPVGYATGGAPNEVTVDDFNGDGNLDLAVANYNDSTVGILLGDGSGGFASQRVYATGGHPASIAVGDFNGDGKADLVTSNEGDPGGASILLGDGSGAFPSHSDYTIGGIPRGRIAVGDLNGDGHQDIAIACANSDGVSVLLGDGKGGFTVTGPYATGSHPTSVAAADFRGIGVLDLAAANYWGGDVGVLTNDGSATFGAPMSLAAGSSPREVAVGDFDNDGLLDLVVSNMGDNNVELFRQLGDKITTSASFGGTVHPGTRLYSSDATPTYTFTAIAGYHLAEVKVDGTPVTLTGANSYTFPALASDHTLAARFAPNADNVPTATVRGWKAGWQRWSERLFILGHRGPYGIAVAKTQWRLNGGPWRSGSPLIVDHPGVTYVDYHAVDVNGVVGPTHQCIVKIDVGLPQVIARSASGKVGAVLWIRYFVRDPRPSCGTALVRVCVLGDEEQLLIVASALHTRVNRWQALRVSTRALRPGKYLVVLRARDDAGNFQRGVTRVTITVRQ